MEPPYIKNPRGKLLALREFIKEGFRPPAILFTETKERCQRIMGELLYDGINAMSLCAAKSPAERQKVIQATRLGLDPRYPDRLPGFTRFHQNSESSVIVKLGTKLGNTIIQLETHINLETPLLIAIKVLCSQVYSGVSKLICVSKLCFQVIYYREL